ncbi:MAG: T9SS type A sorting domain-containing protein [Phaeodactylibacter sp.]|nr:T9SS type A sorting domain-containing protein [Phaeodactylibacter sp.]
MKRFPAIVLLMACSTMSLSAQLADSCRLSIGTNLAGPADWGSEWPFVNIMKYSRTWISHNAYWVDGGNNDWDTNVLQDIPMGADGYPQALPVENIPGTEAPQIVRTVWANTEALPEGIYTVLYDGAGTFDFWGDASVITTEPGRILVEVTPGEADIMAMELLTSDAADPIHNIRFLLPGTEETYMDDPWSEAWLSKLSPFNALRFMDWGHTNSSPLQHWDDRPLIDDYTYTPNGIPYEWWAEICNLKQADAWVCIPHAADENYIRQMARLFRDQLDPNLTIYVEYSNEIWNWIFEQTHYCHDNGDQEVPWPERIVPFIQNALDIWTEEFEGQEDRLVRVVGVQMSWQDVSNRIVFNMEPGSFDAFAPAAYFGFNDAGIAELEAMGAAATAEDVINLAREGMVESYAPWIKEQNASIAQELNIPMLYYEGGQHLTPQPFGSVQPYNDALVAAQSHPGMYDLYQEWYDTLRTVSTGPDPGLLMNFSFIGPTSGQYGSWGLLTSQLHQDAPYEDAPKYRAVLDNIYDCSPVVSSVTTLKNTQAIKAFPNPTEGQLLLAVETPFESTGNIEVYNGLGQSVNQRIWPEGQLQVELNLNAMPAGAYTVLIRQGTRIWHKRILHH